MTEVDYQTVPGRLEACCNEMRWALTLRYIRKGYLYQKVDPPKWIHWSFSIKVAEGIETSPICCCPFCGVDLDGSE